MMLLLIKKKPSSLFPTLIPEITSFHFFHLSFSSSTSEDQNPPPKSNLGATASKYITDLTSPGSPSTPESVRHFLKHHGFTDTDICTMVSGCPRILKANVGQTMEPNIQALHGVGFVKHGLQKFIVCNPQALLLPSTIPRIEFWRTLFNGDMKKLVAAFTRNRSLIKLDIDKNVIPKITLLKNYGLSGPQVSIVIGRTSKLFGRSITSMEVLLKRVQELGFPRGSSMFVSGLVSLTCVSPYVFKTKLELFKSFGWTEGEFVAALNKSPFVVCLSEENIRKKMKFLVERAGCPQSYIAFHPTLLNFSLDKRLMPRLHVVEILKSNESVKIKPNLYHIMSYPEKTFMEKIVGRYKEVAPKLHETYVAACGGQL